MALSTLTVRDGNNAAQTIPTMADLAGNLMPMNSLDSAQQVYRASASFTPVGTSDLTLVSIKGSSTKTVRIRRILLGGSSTALGSILMGLQRTSTVGTGGTAVLPTVAKLDTSSATATATVTHFTTAAQSQGTAVGGTLSQFQLFTTTVTTPTVAWAEAQCIFPERGATIGQALVLRGTADFIEIQNLNAGNVKAGSILQYMVEWVEDAS